MTWLSPVDRTSGTLTLSAGTLSCWPIMERPYRSVAHPASLAAARAKLAERHATRSAGA